MDQFIPNTAQESTRLPATGHPWRRYFARMADFTLYGVCWCVIQYLLLRWWPNNSVWYNILEQYIILAFMFLFEPLLLCTWGTTPGKFILGLCVGNQSGGKLTYGEALTRTYVLFAKGMGYGVPVYNLVRMYKSRRATNDSELLEWEEGTSYDMKPMHPARGIALAAVHVVCIVLIVVVIQAAILPLHRGGLTPALFYANCNEMLHRGGSANNLNVDETGFVKVINTDPYVITTFVANPPRYEVTVQNGLVTGVRLEIQGDYFSTMFEFPTHAQVAYMAFVGAQKGASGQKVGAKSAAYAKSLSSPFEFVDYGVRVRNEVTQISDEVQKIVFTLTKE